METAFLLSASLAVTSLIFMGAEARTPASAWRAEPVGGVSMGTPGADSYMCSPCGVPGTSCVAGASAA